MAYFGWNFGGCACVCTRVQTNSWNFDDFLIFRALARTCRRTENFFRRFTLSRVQTNFRQFLAIFHRNLRNLEKLGSWPIARMCRRTQKFHDVCTACRWDDGFKIENIVTSARACRRQIAKIRLHGRASASMKNQPFFSRNLRALARSCRRIQNYLFRPTRQLQLFTCYSASFWVCRP